MPSVLWTFAIIFVGLWALGVETSNNLGLSVHVLLVLGAALAAIGLRQQRVLAWAHAHPHSLAAAEPRRRPRSK